MTLSRWAALGAKVAVPVLGLGVLATALVGHSAAASQPSTSRPRAPHAVPVDSADLVCPGPETIGVRGADPTKPPGSGWVVASTPPWSLVDRAASGPAEGTVAVVAGKASSPVTPGSESGSRLTVGRVPTADPAVVQARGASAPGVVAEQIALVESGDLRGLSTATCLEPQDDIWLVGGGTEPGRRGRLVLSNPHDATARVSVDVLGAGGMVARTPGSTVALAPHSRTVLLLDALAPGVQSPVVHVRSSGGSVGAVLNDSWLDGLTPLGSDDVVASLPPAERVVVPGVRLGGTALLRIAAPGPAEAVVQVHLYGEKGPVDLGDAGVVRIDAGSSHDIDLSHVPGGAYAIQVDSDEPVLAGAMVRTARTAAGGDLAWSASAGPVSSLAGVAKAVQTGRWKADLELSAPGKAASADVVTMLADGSTTTTRVDVTAGTTRVIPLGGESAWLRPAPGSGPVYAGRFLVIESAGGQLVSAGPVRQVSLTRVPADVAAAAD